MRCDMLERVAANSAQQSTRRALLASIAGANFLFAPMVKANADAQAVLLASDAIRNPQQAFRVTVTLTEFERGQQVDTSTLQSYARSLEASGQFATLLRFVQPARDVGKLMLKSGVDLWFYDPSTKASVRVSPQQRLMGQASNGDVVTVNFARDYTAALVAEESTTDGERKPRKALKLLLTAANDGAAYGSIELWVDADSSAPIKARFLSESGRLLKTAFYRRFQRQLGAERPTETVIIDGLTPTSVTIVRFSDYAARNIPISWFQRDYLPRFQPD
jgi:Outer membrane lipoprotein-sorting protein